MSKQQQLALIEDQSALKDAITAHGKARGKMDRETQRLALSAIAVFKQHGNVFYINHLYANMGKGARHVALTAWFLAVGGVMANIGENKAATPFIKDPTKAVDMEAAAKTPWYEMKPSKAPDEVVDLLKLVSAVLKKAKGEGKQLAHGEMLEPLEALVAAHARADEAADTIEG